MSNNFQISLKYYVIPILHKQYQIFPYELKTLQNAFQEIPGEIQTRSIRQFLVILYADITNNCM